MRVCFASASISCFVIFLSDSCFVCHIFVVFLWQLHCLSHFVVPSQISISNHSLLSKLVQNSPKLSKLVQTCLEYSSIRKCQNLSRKLKFQEISGLFTGWAVITGQIISDCLCNISKNLDSRFQAQMFLRLVILYFAKLYTNNNHWLTWFAN